MTLATEDVDLINLIPYCVDSKHVTYAFKIIPYRSTSAMAIARCRAAGGGSSGAAVLGAATVAVSVWLVVASMCATADAAAVLDGDYGE